MALTATCCDIAPWLSMKLTLALKRKDTSAFANTQRHSVEPTTALADNQAFEAFFRRYEPRITGYLWRMLANADEVSDLCQETFLRAWQQFALISTYSQPASWLFRVATNLALNHLNRRKPVSLEEIFEPSMSDPAGHVIEREIIRQTLLALSAKSRAILVLRDLYNMPYQEIGNVLAMSPDSVKMALCRAREQFRQHYTHKQGANR